MSQNTLIAALALRQAGTRQLVQIEMLRKAHQRDMAVADMIATVAASTPAPGAASPGRLVDRRA